MAPPEEGDGAANFLVALLAEDDAVANCLVALPNEDNGAANFLLRRPEKDDGAAIFLLPTPEEEDGAANFWSRRRRRTTGRRIFSGPLGGSGVAAVSAGRTGPAIFVWWRLQNEFLHFSRNKLIVVIGDKRSILFIYE